MTQNVTGRKIQYVKSDNGAEYTSIAFVQYLTSKGIQHQFTIPRTPEQNGVAERMNRALQESGRSMLHGAGLPDGFWAEALLTAAILRNRSPTKAVQYMTPYQHFHGTKQNVSNFRVFGCTAYLHVPMETRRKWDAKSIKCIFVGYCIGRKGYRLWDSEAKKIHLSREVAFSEHDFDGCIIARKELSVS